MDATAITTTVLVVITAYYARQNKRMVDEMAASRELAVLPKLALSLNLITPTVATVKVVNVGTGPALDVDITIRFERHEGAEGVKMERRFRTSVMAPGESHEFLPQPNQGISLYDTEQLAFSFARVRLTGTLRDALGQTRQVDEATPDIAEWRRLSAEAKVRWQADPEKRLAEELGKQLAKPFARIEGRLKEIAKSIDGS